MLHKMLVVDRRPSEDKRLKDLETIQGLWDEFSGDSLRKERVNSIFQLLAKKQQKTIRFVADKYALTGLGL